MCTWAATTICAWLKDGLGTTLVAAMKHALGTSACSSCQHECYVSMLVICQHNQHASLPPTPPPPSVPRQPCHHSCIAAGCAFWADAHRPGTVAGHLRRDSACAVLRLCSPQCNLPTVLPIAQLHCGLCPRRPTAPAGYDGQHSSGRCCTSRHHVPTNCSAFTPPYVSCHRHWL